MRKETFALRHNSNVGEPAYEDGQQGSWSRKTLIKMDQQFRERLARALRRGAETAPGSTVVRDRERQR
jgi:hypothetical protein